MKHLLRFFILSSAISGCGFETATEADLASDAPYDDVASTNSELVAPDEDCWIQDGERCCDYDGYPMCW